MAAGTGRIVSFRIHLQANPCAKASVYREQPGLAPERKEPTGWRQIGPGKRAPAMHHWFVQRTIAGNLIQY